MGRKAHKVQLTNPIGIRFPMGGGPGSHEELVETGASNGRDLVDEVRYRCLVASPKYRRAGARKPKAPPPPPPPPAYEPGSEMR